MHKSSRSPPFVAHVPLLERVVALWCGECPKAVGAACSDSVVRVWCVTQSPPFPPFSGGVTTTSGRGKARGLHTQWQPRR